MPKAELHCHLEGTASPPLVRRQAARYGVDIATLLDGDRYRWHDFASFLRAYGAASALFRTEEDYAELAETYLASIAGSGAIYAEFFISPDHAEAAGLSPGAYAAAVAEGIRSAEAEHGIVARLIVVGVRHLGVESVERAARFAAGMPPLVTGFGLAGDEGAGDPADFARAFAIARDAGLGLTAHAGEFRGADAIRRTLDALQPSRLGHGVRAVEDPDLVRRIAAVGIVLEVCPGSNLALGVYPSPDAHPLPRLRTSGCRVTLNSDDPPFFGTTLAGEYVLARDAMDFSDADLLAATRTAIEAAFVDEATRRDLLHRLDIDALGSASGRD
ncbi:adenosine deaminase [Aureimonas leprariae]|uniref:Adenine deaminase n=1 Tax=Plantimonas leprariae TaxID=2615207 RepID=A0A7V7PTG3_9HYPH|nr:adenosine deaminase [Aureimonas leprariae]KAB0683000.1 adenosine deaminase [Aureimonas leprariae]